MRLARWCFATVLVGALWMASPTRIFEREGGPSPSARQWWEPPPDAPRTLTELGDRLRTGWYPSVANELYAVTSEAVGPGNLPLFLDLADAEAGRLKMLPIDKSGVARVTAMEPIPGRPGACVVTGQVLERTYLLREIERTLGRFASREVYERARRWALDEHLPVLCRIEAVRLVRWQFDGLLEEVATNSDGSLAMYLVPLDPRARFGDSDFADTESFLQSLADAPGSEAPRPPDDGWDEPSSLREAALIELEALRRWGEGFEDDPPLPERSSRATAEDLAIELYEDRSRPLTARLRQLDRLAERGEYGLQALLLLLDRAIERSPLEAMETRLPAPRPTSHWANS